MGETAPKIAVITETGGGYMSPDEATQAFRDGTARAPRTAEEMAAIRTQEAQAIRQEQFGGTANQLRAFATKAVDVTGLARPLAVAWERAENGDAAAKRLEDNLRGLEEVNPFASAAGTVTSMLAPTVAAKGLGALAKGEGALAKGAQLLQPVAEAATLPMRGVSAMGRGVEGAAVGMMGKGWLGTVASKAAGLGMETAIMGGQSELSKQLTEEALGNHALNAERIFQSASHDFLYGAVLGGALGVGSVLAKKATGGVSRILGKESIEQWGNEQIWQAAGPTKAMSKNVNAKYAGGAAEVGEHAVKNAEELIGRKMRSFDDLAEVVEKGIERDGQRIEQSLAKGEKALEKAGQRVRMAETLNEAQAKALEQYSQVGAGAQREKIVRFFDEARAKFGIADEAANALKGEAFETSLQDLWQLRRDAEAAWTNFGNKLIPKEDAFKAIRSALEDRVMAKMDLASELGGEAVGKEYRAAKDSFAKFRDLSKAVESGEARAVTNQPLGLTDKMMGAAGAVVGSTLGGGWLGSMAGGAVTGLASKAVRARFPYLAQELASRAADIADVARVASTARAEMRGTVAELLDAGRVSSERVVPHVVSVFGNGDPAPKVTKVLHALNDTAAQAERVGGRTSPLSASAPKTANALAAHTAAVTNYLRANAPQPQLTSVSLTPWATPPSYSQAEVAKFARALAVASDPMGVIRRVTTGAVGQAEIDALKALYPETYHDARNEFMTQLFNPAKKAKVQAMPIGQRLSLARLFDIPTTLTDPGFVAAMQQQNIADKGPEPSEQATQPARQHDAQLAQVKADSMRTDTEELHGTD